MLEKVHRGIIDMEASNEAGDIKNSFSKALWMTGAASIFFHRHDEQGKTLYLISKAISSLVKRGVQAIVSANVRNNQCVLQEVLATIDPLRIPVVLLPWFHYDRPLAYVIYDQGLCRLSRSCSAFVAGRLSPSSFSQCLGFGLVSSRSCCART